MPDEEKNTAENPAAENPAEAAEIPAAAATDDAVTESTAEPEAGTNEEVAAPATAAPAEAKKEAPRSQRARNRGANANQGDQHKEQHGRGRGKGGGGRGGKGRGRGRGGEREEKEFLEEVLEVARVTRVVKGGRRLRFRATVVIGDRKGRVGLGTGKSVEVAAAVQKGVAAAKKNLITVPMEGGTIPHELKWKHKSARILLMPATEGTGIIAGGALRKIADLAGIENILGKSYGTNNKLVNAQAMMQALQAFRSHQVEKEAGQKSKKETAESETTVGA